MKTLDQKRRERLSPPSANGTHMPLANLACGAPPDAGISAAELMTTVLPEPVIIVEDLLVEGLNLFAGRPKGGKSWAALNMAMAVASGGIALGKLKATAGDVLYLALEDNRRRLKKRLAKMLGDLQEAPTRLDFRCEWFKLDKGGYAHLREWLTDHPAAKLVIIDTMAKVRSARKRSGPDYDDDYEVFASLQALASEFHVAFLVITHTRKTDAEDIFDTVNGSTAITGAADSIVILKRQRGQNSATLHATGRDIEEKEWVLKWVPEYGLWQLEGDAAELPPVLTGLSRDIFDLMDKTNKDYSPAEVARVLEKNAGTIRVTMLRMEEKEVIRDVGHGRYSLIRSDTIPL